MQRPAIAAPVVLKFQQSLLSQAELQQCQAGLAAAKAEAARLRRAATAAQQRCDGAAGDAAAVAAERAGRQAADAALAGAKVALAAKADLIKDLRARVSRTCDTRAPLSVDEPSSFVRTRWNDAETNLHG